MFKTLEIEKRAIISIDLYEKTLKIKSKHLKYQKKLEISLRRIKTDRLNLKKNIETTREVTMKPFIHIPEHHERPKWESVVTIYLVAKMMIEYQKLYKADSRQFNDEMPGGRL